MTIALIGAGASGEGANAATTATGYTTTGATLLIACCSSAVDVATPTIADSNSNSGWVTLTSYGTNAGWAKMTIFYCPAPSTLGADHTVTVTRTSGNMTVGLLAFSGTDSSSYDAVTGANVPAASFSSQPGSITPAVANELMICAAGLYHGTGMLINEGFTMQLERSGGGSYYSVHIGYKIKTDSTAQNPTISDVGSSSLGGISMAAFKPAGGGGSSSLPLTGGLMGSILTRGRLVA